MSLVLVEERTSTRFFLEEISVLAVDHWQYAILVVDNKTTLLFGGFDVVTYK